MHYDGQKLVRLPRVTGTEGPRGSHQPESVCLDSPRTVKSQGCHMTFVEVTRDQHLHQTSTVLYWKL